MNSVKIDFLILGALVGMGFNNGYAAKPVAVSIKDLRALHQHVASSNVMNFAIAYKTVQEAIANITYPELALLRTSAQQTKEKIDVLAQVIQANVWEDFKQIIEQINLQAQQAVQKESREELSYAQQYLKEEQGKQQITAQRKLALGLIQARAHFILDASFRKVMRHAEQYPAKMQAYFSQAKQNAEAIYSLLDAEYHTYEKINSYDAKTKKYVYRVVKKSKKEQNESSCALQ